VPANTSKVPASTLGAMAEDPVKARSEPEPVDPPPDESVPAPDAPVVLASAAAESALEVPLALEDFVADVVVVVPEAPAAA